MTAASDVDHDRIRRVAARVLRAEAEALAWMADCPTEGFVRAVMLMLGARGRVIVSGMGKSGHIARKIAATLASTGTPALFLHLGEASHGDLGMVTGEDVCLLLSNSGETCELSDLIKYSRRFGIPMIAITRVSDSTLARSADVVLLLPDMPEACAIGMALMFFLIPISSVIGDRMGYYLIPIQAMIFARLPYLPFRSNHTLHSALPYLGLLLVFVVWSQLSGHFQKCYIPYQTWLFGFPGGDPVGF